MLPVYTKTSTVRFVSVEITGQDEIPTAEAALNAVEAQGYVLSQGIVQHIAMGAGRYQTVLHATFMPSSAPKRGKLLVRSFTAEMQDDELDLSEIDALRQQGYRIVKEWNTALVVRCRRELIMFAGKQFILRGWSS